jgi:hypothetical protein
LLLAPLNAIRVPSGDHAGFSSVKVVVSLMSPLPSGFIEWMPSEKSYPPVAILPFAPGNAACAAQENTSASTIGAKNDVNLMGLINPSRFRPSRRS